MTDDDGTHTSKYHGQEVRDVHAVAIGRIAIAWNELHEHLAEIFGTLFEEADYGLALTAWHSLVNDAAQREMLRSVAGAKLGRDSKGYKEINWSLEQIKQQIANQRNTGIHMPLMLFTDMSNPEQPGEPQMLPLSLFGNRRAFSMSGKDLLKEYALYEQQIRRLGTYLDDRFHETCIMEPMVSMTDSLFCGWRKRGAASWQDGGRAVELAMTNEEIERLTALSRSRTEPREPGIAGRRCCWPIASNPSFCAVGQSVGVHHQTVQRCVERALGYGPLAAIEGIDHGRGKEPVISRRRPKPGWWSLACDKAKEHGYPHELWTTRLLARHAREHGPTSGHECLARLVQGTVCKILGQE